MTNSNSSYAGIGAPETIALPELNTFHRNPRQGDVQAIKGSIQTNGLYRPIIVNRGTHTGRPLEVLAGNHTLKAYRELAEENPGEYSTIDCWVVDVDDDRANRIVLADNRTADLGGYDNDELLELLDSLDGDTIDEQLLGTGYDDGYLNALLGGNIPDDWNPDDDGGETSGDDYSLDSDSPAGVHEGQEPALQSTPISDQLVIFPSTVFDSTGGRWATRKKEWAAVGVTGSAGREGELTYQGQTNRYRDWYEVKNRALGENPGLTDEQIEEQYADQLTPYNKGGSTSVFDPVLAEILTLWFTNPGDKILDPWAGGAVRGLVTTTLGRDYTGHELRQEQIDQNLVDYENYTPLTYATTGAAIDLQAGDRPSMTLKDVTPEEAHTYRRDEWPEQTNPDGLNPAEPEGAAHPDLPEPRWVVGDSRDTMQQHPDGSFDMALGCPPYYDLEEYSENEADLSNMDTADFEAAMADTLAIVDQKLRDDRFACFIVGSARDRHGDLRDMKTLMINAAPDGWKLANDAVLVTQVGSGRFRASRGFNGGRSLIRRHQDILVFVKGDRKRAVKRLHEVHVSQLGLDR